MAAVTKAVSPSRPAAACTGADALEMLTAGATMIDILTAFVFRGWNTAAKLKTELLALMDQRGIVRAADLAPGQRG
jgi:dihydroorotate dehydrogenase